MSDYCHTISGCFCGTIEMSDYRCISRTVLSGLLQLRDRWFDRSCSTEFDLIDLLKIKTRLLLFIDMKPRHETGPEVMSSDFAHNSYQRGSPCKDPAGNRTTRRPPDHRKETANFSGMVMFPRSSGLAKTILQGTVKGGRRQGRQRKRWEDNIREWTGLEFAKSQRAVENWDKWRKLVAKSSWLRDR